MDLYLWAGLKSRETGRLETPLNNEGEKDR
jgi:hypothetical protein